MISSIIQFRHQLSIMQPVLSNFTGATKLIISAHYSAHYSAHVHTPLQALIFSSLEIHSKQIFVKTSGFLSGQFVVG